MSEVLAKDYVLELLKAALSSNKVMDIVTKHLKYELLETEAQKRIFKYMVSNYNVTNVTPTIGMIGQANSTNQEVIATLAKMQKINIKGKEDQIIAGFQSFIKDIRFQAVLHKVAELYNNNKPDEAVAYLASESKAIEDFNIKEKYYHNVFGQFNERMADRELKSLDDAFLLARDKIVTGIHQLDRITRGGYKRGTSFLVMARSGVGKSTYLRWVALANARLGKRVVFFQAEATTDQTTKAFDKAWTAINDDDLDYGNVPPQMKTQIEKIRREIVARGGEIIIPPNEQFEKLTIEECNATVDEIEKLYGKVDLVLFDYLELFSTKGNYGKGESAERRRRENVGEQITSMATARNCVTGTATQAAEGGVNPQMLNNVDFCLTRHHASEFKGVLKPFSYFVTFNATEEEYKQQELRIFCDKFRWNQGAGSVIKIAQARDIGRFYDSEQTRLRFFNWYDIE